jgi:hypothetical protein
MAIAGIQVYSTNQAAKATFKAQNEQATSALEERTDAAEEELGQRMKEFRKARARARVAGGESGAQGQSFAVSLNQSVQDQNIEAGIVNKNLVLGQRKILTDLNVANASVRTVSGLEAGLQIGGAGLSAFSAADKAKKAGSIVGGGSKNS